MNETTTSDRRRPLASRAMPCHAVLAASVVVLLALWSTNTATSAAADPPLTPALKRTFEAVRQAWYAGDSYEVWQVMAPTVARVREPQIDALNRALGAEGIPPVEELLVDARLKLVQQDLWSAMPEPGIRERLLTLTGLDRKIAETLERLDDHPLLAAAPRGHDLEQLEERLWELHVLKNELLVADRCARYAARLAGGIPARTAERLSETERDLVKASREPPLGRIDERRRQVVEAELALRLHRLEAGVAILADPALRRERFLAAWSTQFDGRVLAAFFAQRQAQPEQAARFPLARRELSDPAVPTRIGALSGEASRLAGEQAERARLFFEGLHWWLRGRYGAGPDVGGLAKSAAALSRSEALVWLSLPARPPEPTDPADVRSPAVPASERRHHYTWAWEDRRVQQRARYSVRETRHAVRIQSETFW